MDRVEIAPGPLDTPCWIWGMSKFTAGYGRTCHNGKEIGAHRLAYELFVGPIPRGLQIDHLCRVRPCCNPAHLEVVTSGENTRRGKPFNQKTHCKNGHEYTPENTYILIHPTKGWKLRYCNICRIAHSRKHTIGLRRNIRPGRYKYG